MKYALAFFSALLLVPLAALHASSAITFVHPGALNSRRLYFKLLETPYRRRSVFPWAFIRRFSFPSARYPLLELPI